MTESLYLGEKSKGCSFLNCGREPVSVIHFPHIDPGARQYLCKDHDYKPLPCPTCYYSTNHRQVLPKTKYMPNRELEVLIG
jgi:hypothetical protein